WKGGSMTGNRFYARQKEERQAQVRRCQRISSEIKAVLQGKGSDDAAIALIGVLRTVAGVNEPDPVERDARIIGVYLASHAPAVRQRVLELATKQAAHGPLVAIDGGKR